MKMIETLRAMIEQFGSIQNYRAAVRIAMENEAKTKFELSYSLAKAEKELERLHAENERFRKALRWVDANGMSKSNPRCDPDYFADYAPIIARRALYPHESDAA